MRVLADLDRLRRPVLAKNPQHTARRIDVRDQVNDDPPRVTNGAGQVVNEVEGRGVRLFLTGHDRPAGSLIRPRADTGIVNADNRLHVVGSVQRLLDRPGRDTRERLTLRGLWAVVLDKGVGRGVRRRPLVRVGLKRALTPDEGRLGGERHQLGRGRAPGVVHHLTVPGVADQRPEVAAAVQHDFLAIHGDNRDELARPLVLFQHLSAGQDVLRDLVAQNLARLTNGDHAVRQIVFLIGLVRRLLDHLAGVQQQDRLAHRLAGPVLGHQNAVVFRPAVRIAVRREVNRRGLRIAALELFLGDQLGYERDVPVRRIRRHGVGVAVHPQRIRDALENNVLIPAFVVSIGQVDAEIAEAARRRVIQRRVIGRVGVGRTFDVADQAGNDLGRFRISPAVLRQNLNRRLVLSGVVDDLTNERRQLVDGQARPAVNTPLLFQALVPLLTQPGELHILPIGRAIVALAFLAPRKVVTSLLEEVFVFHPMKPP